MIADRELRHASDALMDKVEQFALCDQKTVDEELRCWLEWVGNTCGFFAPLPVDTIAIHEWVLELQERFAPVALGLKTKDLQTAGGQIKSISSRVSEKIVHRSWQSLAKTRSIAARVSQFDVDVLNDLIERAFLRWDYAVYRAQHQIRTGRDGVQAVRFMRAAWDDYYRLLEELRQIT